MPLGMAWGVQFHACTMQPTWLTVPFSFSGWDFATSLRCTVVRLLSWAHSQPHFPSGFCELFDRGWDSITASTLCKSRLCQRLQAKSRPGASEKGLHLVRVVDCCISLRIVYLVTISQVWVASEDLMGFGVWAANWAGFQLMGIWEGWMF